MKNIKLKVLKFILIIALVLGTLTTSVFAWFSSKYNTISTKISGSIVFEYFHAGDGSKEHPFIITRPIHYYHMVEFFQRTTILDVGNGESLEFGKEYIYFQIGCPLAQLGNPSNTNNPVNEDDWYVFDYNNAGGAVEYVNEGTIVPGTNVLASKTLNMAYYSGERALMPTGSSQIPFLGLIDGHNMTIDNLHIVSHSIVNVQDANGVVHKNVERFTADMGVFGCIAQGIDINGDNKIEDDLENGLHEASSVKNLYITNATIDLEGTASTTEMVGDLPSLPDGSPTHSNSYHLVNEDGEVSENGTAVAYVGYIAGHVYSTEGVIEYVYVNNCRIVGGSKAISGYGYFGVIIDPTTSEVVSSLGSQIANIYTQGDGSGFGGSISMTDLVERIAGVRADAPNIRNITAETVIIDEVENTITRTATAYANADAYNPSRNTEKIQYYYTPEAGLYYLYYRSSTNGVGYNYLYGENNHIQTKTITTITYEKDSETGSYKVVDGYKVYGPNATYLGVNGTFNPVAAEEEDAIILAFDNSNHLYYIAKVPYEQNYDYPYNDNENGVGYVDTIYYLNATNNYMSVDTSVNASSTWAFDGSNRLYTTNGNTRYYLDYDKDAWYLTPSTTFYIFKDGEGHFLKLTNTTLGATELEGEASKFEIASPGGTTTISTIMNGARYYLRSNNGVLELSTTASNNQWSYDNTNSSYYITVGSTKYYLAYYNNSWVVRPEGYLYKISDNGNYLNATNTTSFNNVTVPANASFWKLDPNAQSTTISTIINGTVTYLGINNNGALALNTSYSSTLWIKDGDAYYTEVSGAKLYLGYENGSWRVGLTGYKIYSGNNYLNAQSTTAVNNITTGATNASTWVFDPDAATTEFYTFYSGTKVYLGRNGYNLAVSTSSTTWTKDSNNKYYITIDGTKFYLVFKNNAWALENEGYKINDGSTNYLTATSTTAFGNTTEANALAWIMDTSAATTTIATIYNGTKVYLGRNGYNLAVSTTSTTWTKESTNKYYITIDGVKFYVVYKNNAWTLEYEGHKISDGTTNYLTATSTTAFGNTTEANALVWFLDPSAASTTISTIYNGTKTYLGINNGALALNTSYSSTTWTKEGNNYYVLVSGEKAYLIYDGGWKIAFDGYKISDGTTNYLTATSTTAFGNTTEANALVWFLDPSAASTTIATIYNGTKTYLGINNGALALNTSYSSTTWTKEGNSYYTLVAGEKAYLIYDSGWKVAFDGYRIKNTANNNFLNATSTTAFGNQTTETSASIWFLDPSAASTTIATIYNGTKTYLGINNGALALNTSYSSTTWTKEGNSYYTLVAGEKAYLIYDSGWKVAFDGYRIKNTANNNFLNATSTTAFGNQATETSASIWFLDPSAASTTIATIYNGTKTYLGINNGALALNTSYSSTTWTKEGNTYYIEYNGLKYYLVYDSGWKVVYNTYKIKDNSGNYYLNATSATAFGNQTTANNASAWILDVDAETTTISCYYSNTRTYLGIDTDENLALNASYSGTLWTKEGSSYYTTYNGIKYYLTYKFNAWRALPKERVRFNMSNYYMYIYSTSYVRRSGTPNDNGPYDFYHDSQGRYYGFYNNTKCYLRNNNGTVQISTTIGRAALFVREGDTLYTQSGNDKLFLMYNGSGNNNSNNNWSVRIAETITYAISDGEGHYIRVTGTTTSSYESVDNVEDATKFTFSSTTSGTISTKVGNTTYYLRNNGGTLQVSTTSTTWTINGYSISNGGYYLKYNNGNWTLSNTAPASDYYVAKSGASYMGYSGTNVVVTTEDADNLLLFSSVPAQNNDTNITISVRAGSNTYYLYCTTTNNSNVTLSNTSRNWRYNTSGQLLYRYSNRTSYYIRVSGDSWQVNTTQGNASTIEFELYNPTYKVKLTSFEEGYSVIYGDYENTYAQTLTDATPTKNITLRTVTSTKDLTLRTVTSTKNFTPIAYASTKNFTLNVYTPTSNFTPSGYTPEFVFSTSLYSSAKDITVELENIIYSFTDTVLLVMSYDLDEQKTFTTTTQTNQKTGFTTYMPIRVPQSSEADYDADNLYKASSKNTGYIIGGGNYYENNTSVGDIRVSRYAKSNISKYTGAITTLHTVDGSGNRALTDTDTEKYLSFNDVTTTEKDEQGNEVEVTLPGAKSQFDSMIGSFADGLHFMDSLISKDRLITVPQATILNRTYYDYQLPQDCIDFKVLKRGAISFFAGEYFSGNNAFFSLHQIFRDNNQNITDIKEIIYVYKYKNAKLGTADYIYLYDDDSYGRINQETGDFEVVQYDDISNVLTYYEIAFNTAWITNPTGVSSNNQYVYYFEIPCNKGEYALGSVDGKIGAYLLYLDIAANGGDEVDSVVSGQGNDVSTSFKVDFRSPGETSDFAIMQLFINCPNEANASSTDVNERLFNVNVVFDSTETGDGVYSSGIYNIYITNKVAGSTAKVDVFLVDTDNDIMTPFPYAFRIIYTNIDYENVTILNIAELDFYQSVGSFEIPATGTAVETSYN